MVWISICKFGISMYNQLDDYAGDIFFLFT